MASSSTLDTVVIGGGISGLSAALTLARVCRSVLVFDSGSHRNSVAPHSYNFITRDGSTPAELLAAAHADLEPYNVEIRQGWIERVERAGSDFALCTRSGETVTARTVILATGLTDTLPEIPGLAEAWGRNVVHCPYCHGYELRGRATIVLGHEQQDVDKAGLLVGLTNDVTLCTGGADRLDTGARSLLDARGVRVEEREVVRAIVEGEEVTAVEFANGEQQRCGAIYLSPRLLLANSLAESLGVAVRNECELVTSDSGRTGVPGVYAAGDGSGSAHQLIAAAKSGFEAACAANSDLLDRGVRFNS